jgi:hypothetical protein
VLGDKISFFNDSYLYQDQQYDSFYKISGKKIYFFFYINALKPLFKYENFI